jgi:hypothetical protein
MQDLLFQQRMNIPRERICNIRSLQTELHLPIFMTCRLRVEKSPVKDLYLETVSQMSLHISLPVVNVIECKLSSKTWMNSHTGRGCCKVEGSFSAISIGILYYRAMLKLKVSDEGMLQQMSLLLWTLSIVLVFLKHNVSEAECVSVIRRKGDK